MGDFIRKLRESKDMPLRKLAAELDIDQSTLSKYERGERLIKEELIPKLAVFFNVNEERLRISYMGDKILFSILNDQRAEEILEVAEEKLKYYKNLHAKQGNIF
ncbi:hypothetical protein C900_02298 [Fulvivirga imtechensis AK7]|uniref:HTH cro/C1-type domain-containing protein n=1 Tax=Fulvivirga imtechensis AK7 TaxID=1237149 RepID=L8JTY2_9BACT|nr:hypothetical protein C900_02298 [Fulvivirga imtechensis AK7]